MITGLIAVIIIVACVLPAESNGSTGTMWTGIVIAALVLIFGMGWREDDRAYVNRTHYWSMSGKDRARARRRWEAEARAEEARERARKIQRSDRSVNRAIRKALKNQKKREMAAVQDDRPTDAELLEARRKREAYIAQKRMMNKPSAESGPVRVCHYCGRSVRAYGQSGWDGHRRYVEYRCPRCGRMNQTQIRA